MNPSRQILIYLMLSLACQTGLHAQKTIELGFKDKALLDSLCEAHLTESDIPGMAVGIVSKGKVLYARGFGVRNLKSQYPVTKTSIFHLASISKTFVATAIGQLIAAGKINLEDPVTKHLPYFELANPKYKDITIKHLLTHTAGVPDVMNYNWRQPEYGEDALENYVRDLNRRGLNFTPGEKFKYSNNGFEVLGDVIAKASGMSFEAYIQTHIFDPLDMDNSTFIKPDVPGNIATSPHVKRPGIKVSKVYPYNREHAPSSTLNSNVEDMMKYALMYLNQGTYEGKIIIDRATYELITTKHWTFNEERGVGLSWFIGPASWRRNDGTRIEHSGQDTGYKSWLGILPEKSWAMIVLYNGDWKTPQSDAIFDAAYEMAERYE